MKKLFLYLLFIPLVHTISAQEGIQHILYNFSEEEGYNQSEIRHVLAEDSFFLVTGKAERSDGQRTVFVAAYDYEGEQLWNRKLSIPEGMEWLTMQTHENLKPFPGGYYAIGGNADEVTSGGDTVGHPFVYIFDKDGDSIHYYQYDNEMNIELGVLNLDKDSNLLLGGVRKFYNESYEPTLWPEDTLLTPTIWIGRYFEDHTHKSLISNFVQSGILRYSNVRNIFQPKGSNHFFIGGNRGIAPYNLSILMADTLNGFIDSIDYSFSDFEGYSFDPYNGIFPNYDYSLQQSRYNDWKTIFAFPMGPEDFSGGIAAGGSAIIFGKRTKYSGTPITRAPFELYTEEGDLLYFHFNQLLKIREAWNTDILAIKPMATDYDDSLSDYILDPMVGRTLYLRADSSGAVYEHRFIEYYPYESIEDGGQILQDIDQRPDSKKIIMGGYIQATEAIPGKWDAVGKTSWIVIMDDTSTTIPPASIQRSEAALNFELYPNPGRDYITVRIPENTVLRKMTYQIYGIRGEITTSGTIRNREELIDVQHLIPGNYYIVISSEIGKKGSKSWIKL